ncbi:hypothetical protein HYW74_04490 [Candidatus Pacearchaeota archaeon]|nr:hypothetical protein [Candidatus Pacearchaeota archaeon]
MPLDDIVMGEVKKSDHIAQLGGLAGNLKSIEERIRAGKGPSDSGVYDPRIMQAVITLAGDVDPEHANLEVLREMPPEIVTPIITKYLGKAYQKAKNDLVSNVEPEYREVIADLDDGNKRLGLIYQLNAPENIEDTYAEIKKAHESTKKWKDMLEKKDVNAYIAQIQNPVLKEIFNKYPSPALKYIERRAGIEQQIFLANFTKKPAELIQAMHDEDTEKVNKLLNPKKLEEYLTFCVEGSKDKQDVYESLGIIYSVYSAEKARAKADKKTKKEYEEGLKAA